MAPASTLSTTLPPTLASIPPLDPEKVAATPQVPTGNGSNRPGSIIAASQVALVPGLGIEGSGSIPSHSKETSLLISRNTISTLDRKRVMTAPIAKGNGNNRSSATIAASKAASVPEVGVEGPGNALSHPEKISSLVSKSTIPKKVMAAHQVATGSGSNRPTPITMGSKAASVPEFEIEGPALVSESTIPPLDSKKVTATHQVATGNGNNRPSSTITASKAASVPGFGVEGPGNSHPHPGKIASSVSKSTAAPLDPKKVAATRQVATGSGSNHPSSTITASDEASVPAFRIAGPGNTPLHPETIAPLVSKSTTPPRDPKKITAIHHLVVTGNGSNRPSSIIPASKAVPLPELEIKGPGISPSHLEKIAPLASKSTAPPLDPKKITAMHHLVVIGNGSNRPNSIITASKAASVPEFGIPGLGNSPQHPIIIGPLASKATIPPLDQKKVTTTHQVVSGSNRPSSIIPASKAALVPELGIKGLGNPPSHPKKIAPLVSKNNFLYYEPVVGGKDKISGS